MLTKSMDCTFLISVVQYLVLKLQCDFTDSVKTLLGKQVKILFKNVVRLETKGDKTENRVLVSQIVMHYAILLFLILFESSTLTFRCWRLALPIWRSWVGGTVFRHISYVFDFCWESQEVDVCAVASFFQ